MSRHLPLVAALLLAATLGCGGPPVYHVSGTVTFKDQPVPEGGVFFDPVGGTASRQGYAKIVNGAYDTAASGGIPVEPGTYRARVQGFDGKPDVELPSGRPLFRPHEEEIVVGAENASKHFTVKP